MTESLLLVIAGAALGWLFAIGATQALSRWSELDLNLAPDRTVLLFAFAISATAALVFGLAPLRSVLRVPIGITLKTSAATAHQDRSRMWGRKMIIALQVSLCLMLLIGAGLLVRTLRNLENVNLGIRTSGLLIFGVTPQQIQSSEDSVRFYESFLNRLRTLPGVESITLMGNRIGSGWSNNTGAFVDGKNPQGDASSPMRWNDVGANYFHTLGTPLLYGRDFTEADSDAAPKVAIINETFAKRYLKNQNPLGHNVALSGDKNAPQFTIVGIAADSKYTNVREEEMPTAYFPYKQLGEGWSSTMHVELRTSRNPSAFLPEVQRAVREFAPDLPLLQPMTQQRQFESSFTQERLIGRLSLFFGLLAVVLVATGLYGTLTYTVSRRTTELGVRMALGAQRGTVLWMVLRESLWVCLAGIAIGLPVAIVCSRLLRSMLFGLAPGDPLTIAVALVGIAVVALIASFIPARRAASVDPMVALRHE